MNIIICGAGEVGRHAAEALGTNGNDITIIDIKAAKLAAIEDSLDVRTLVGNGTQADARTLHRRWQPFQASLGRPHRSVQVEDRPVQGAALANATNPRPRHVHQGLQVLSGRQGFRREGIHLDCGRGLALLRSAARNWADREVDVQTLGPGEAGLPSSSPGASRESVPPSFVDRVRVVQTRPVRRYFGFRFVSRAR